MRHGKKLAKLGRPTDQRLALLRSLVTALFLHREIKTTDARAKAAKRVAEKMVALAKRGDLHGRRQIFRVIRDAVALKNVYAVAEANATRAGGVTRITKVCLRRGDGATVSSLELLA